MEASLYVHVPYCERKKCDYCDFFSIPIDLNKNLNEKDDPRLAQFIENILLEGEELFSKWKPQKVPTLYIGGGTPSVLGSAGISRLLEGLTALIGRYSPLPEEITVEANPGSADEAFMRSAREGGATRLSLGIQTFHAPSREAVSRAGTEKLLNDSLALAAQYFPGAFSVDLVTGFPFQNEEIILGDIERVAAFSPAHVSLYALTLEQGTPLALRASINKIDPKLKSTGKSFLPGPDEADRLWLSGRDKLEKSGFYQYEVSNFCRSDFYPRNINPGNIYPGNCCWHNVRYWRMLNWLALGPSASGTIIDDENGTGTRFTYATEEMTKEPKILYEELDQLTLIKETFIMGFRYLEGPDWDLFKRRFHIDIADCIPKTLSSWMKMGLLKGDRPALTKEGLLLLNRFLMAALEELDLLRAEW